jgi:hypothetical protein
LSSRAQKTAILGADPIDNALRDSVCSQTFEVGVRLGFGASRT